MPFVVAALIVLAVVLALNLLLTTAVIRRLREHTQALAALGPVRPVSAAPGTPVAAFTATAVDGTEVSREFFSTPTVVAAFSTDCRACHERLPEFTAYLTDAKPERVLVVVAGDEAGAAEFATALDASVTVVVEPPGQGPVCTALSVTHFPTFYQVGVVDGETILGVVAGTPAGLSLGA